MANTFSNFFSKHSSLRSFLFVLLVFMIIFLAAFTIQRVNTMQKTADDLGAKIDWQAVARHQPPYYLLQYKVARIQYDGAEVFRQRVEGSGIAVDVWEEYEHEAIGAVSKQNIQKLKDNGFVVTVLANSYDEYYRSPEFTVNRGKSIKNLE